MLVPIKVIAPIATTAIRPTNRPYSTKLAPVSSRRRRFNRFFAIFIVNIFFGSLGGRLRTHSMTNTRFAYPCSRCLNLKQLSCQRPPKTKKVSGLSGRQFLRHTVKIAPDHRRSRNPLGYRIVHESRRQGADQASNPIPGLVPHRPLQSSVPQKNFAQPAIFFPNQSNRAPVPERRPASIRRVQASRPSIVHPDSVPPIRRSARISILAISLKLIRIFDTEFLRMRNGLELESRSSCGADS